MGLGSELGIEITKAGDCVEDYVQSVQEDRHVVTTGCLELDDSIEGVSFGEYVVVGARPNHGKTAFAVQWARALVSWGHKSLIFAEEMSTSMMGRRFLTHTMGPGKEGSSPGFKMDQLFGEGCLVVRECETAAKVEMAIRRFAALGYRFHFIDYIQLYGMGRDEYTAVSDVSRRMRKLATELGVVIIAMAQLHRLADSEPPRVAHLKSSGQLEQDADLVILLRHPSRSCPSAYDPAEFEIYCAKRRNGAIKYPVVSCTVDLENQVYGTPTTRGGGEDQEYQLELGG